jgi:hypothetical protein
MTLAGPIRGGVLALAVLLAAPVARAQTQPSAGEPALVRSPSSSSTPTPSGRWLSWTLLGVGSVAAASTLVAFAQRERYAKRWNSADCIEPGRLRGNVCPGELDAIQSWDRVLWVSGVSAALFMGGAVLNRSLEPSSATQTARSTCTLGWAQVACRGEF